MRKKNIVVKLLLITTDVNSQILRFLKETYHHAASKCEDEKL